MNSVLVPRAWLVRVVGMVVVACLAAACSGGGDGPEPSTASLARTGEVRIGVGEDIWPLTGQGATARHFAAGELNAGVYEPLVALAPDFTVRPGLAERWEMVGPTTWRFHLRPNVTWHDGRRFGADDVVWSWTGREALLRSVSGTLSTVTKVDDLTVDFVSTTPNLRLPEQLVHPEGPIVPKDAHNDAEPPVGTGPFKVVEYQPRRQLVVERFDGYWGPKARAERITFRFMPEPEIRLEALRHGEVDMVTGLPRDAVAALEADGFRVVRAPPGATQVLSFSTTGQFVADRALRHAVSLAVDRHRYVAEVLGGNGEPGRWMSPGAVLGGSAASVAPSTFEPARARQILEEAGWKAGADGIRTSGARRLSLTFIGGPAVPEAGLRFIAAQLKDVGIETAVRKAHDIRTGEQNRDRGYDVELAMPNQNDANPAFLLALRTGSDPDYSALVTQVAAAPGREEVQRLAAAMTATLVNRDFAVVPVAGVFHVYGMRKGVDLGEPHPSAISQTWLTLAPSG
ncbi:MAG: ABC transporter substrate-binding protein, partial [Acidimicrobiales bacterium]|nr:ABC transporter substrate-binding protein [Acidimicrobiales bacterium]